MIIIIKPVLSLHVSRNEVYGGSQGNGHPGGADAQDDPTRDVIDGARGIQHLQNPVAVLSALLADEGLKVGADSAGGVRGAPVVDDAAVADGVDPEARDGGRAVADAGRVASDGGPEGEAD